MKVFIAVLILCIIVASVLGQPNTKTTFLSKQKLLEIKTEEKNIRDSHWVGKNHLLIQYDRSRNGFLSTVALVSIKGDEIDKRNYEDIQSISISEDGNRLLISHRRPNSPEEKYYVNHYDVDILDSLGNIVSEIKDCSTPHLKISNSGEYCITTSVGGAEDEGHFQLFDTQTGAEINITKIGGYEWFLADFFLDNEIVIAVQPFPTLIRDKDTRKIIKFVMKTTKLMIYDIDSNSFTLKKELHSKNGNIMWFSGYNGQLATSQKSKIIVLAAHNLSWEEKEAHRPYYIICLDKNGKPLFEEEYNEEKSMHETIVNIQIVDDRYLVTEKYSVLQSKIYFYDLYAREEKWSFNLGPKMEIGLENSYLIDNDKLLLATKRGSFEFNLPDGMLISENKNHKTMRMNSNSRIMMVDKNNKIQIAE